MNSRFQTENKRISLGGRSKATESRAELLKRAQLDRERRAKERAEQKAALVIQAAWRGHFSIAQARSAERAHYGKNFGHSWLHTGRITEGNLDGAVRSLTFFVDPQQLSDVREVCQLAEILLKDTTGRPAFLRLSQLNADGTLQRLVGLAKFTSAAASIISWYGHSRGSCSKEPVKSCINTLTQFLQCTAGRHEWSALGNKAESAYIAFLQQCIKHGVLQKLSSIITSNPDASHSGRNGDRNDAEGDVQMLEAGTETANSDQEADGVDHEAVMGAVCKLFCACLDAAWDSPASIVGASKRKSKSYALQLLSFPFLWTRCSPLRSHVSLILGRFASEAKASQSLDSLLSQSGNSEECAAALLSNLAAAVANIAQETIQDPNRRNLNKADYVILMGVITQLLQKDFVSRIFPKEDGEDDYHAGNAVVAGMETNSWPNTESSLQQTRKEILQMFTGPVICHLAAAVIDSSTGSKPETVGADVGPSLWTWCSLLTTADSIDSDSLQVPLGIALATSHSLVPLLWFSYFKPCLQSGKWYTPEQNVTADPGWQAALTILSRCFSGALSTNSEIDFYAHQRPLPFRELSTSNRQGLLDLLRTSLFQALWSDSRGLHSKAAKAARLRSATATGRLMGQLHSRNCRRQFVDPSVFASEQLNAQMFLAEVTNSLRQGDFLEATDVRVWKILQHAPFLITFEVRAQVLQAVIKADKYSAGRHGIHVRARRQHVFFDGLECIQRAKSTDLKGRMRVSFEDEYGLQEAGIDGGGLFKDFMENLIKQGFDPQFGLFISTSDNRMYPNPNAHLTVDDATQAFEFLGKMVGKALYEGIIVELPLALFFLKQLLHRGAELNDLATLDAELYRNLMFLSSYEGDVEDLALTFTISQSAYDAQREVELVANGKEKAVTSANRSEYILRTANFRLNVETRKYTDAFRHGMEFLIEPIWLSMFNEDELQMLIAGKVSSGLDIQDLKRNVLYGNGYNEEHPTIQLLWEVLEDFTPKQQNLWLKFVTSCSRPPLLGFQHLQPPLTISQSTDDRLPTSSTCSNLLKLPPLTSRENLADKMLFAIEHAIGFHLS